MPFALLEQDGHEGLDAMDHAQHIDVDAPAPVDQVVLPHVALGDRAGAGVVAHHVHRAEASKRLLGERLDRGIVGDVGDHAGNIDALVGECSGCLVQWFFEDIGQHHFHALAAETPAHGLADAAGSAGYDRHSALKVSHCVAMVTWSRTAPQAVTSCDHWAYGSASLASDRAGGEPVRASGG